jgi:hypothetical protein
MPTAALLLSLLFAPAPDGVPEADRTRLAEAFRLAREAGDSVWPGWSGAPFAVVLVTGEREFFIGHPHPPADARNLGRDDLLGRDVFARPRTFSTDFLATFPVEGVSTIVVGQRQNTNVMSSTDWVLKVLHEHFHQLQDSQPGFYEKAQALNLSGGDTTGMWMLNFPFPYDAPAVDASFTAAAKALQTRLQGGDRVGYRAAREKLRTGLAEDARRYLDFQVWKEGVARYTEIRMAEKAAAFEPSAAFRALPDFVPYAKAAAALREDVLRDLEKGDLARRKRLIFYSYGAGEALWLDDERPCWKDDYLKTLFTLEPAFATAAPCLGSR